MNKSNEQVIDSIINGVLDKDNIVASIKNSKNPEDMTLFALRWASKNNDVELVRHLNESHVVSNNNEWLLVLAAKEGSIDILEYLVNEGINLHSTNNAALRWASNENQQDSIDFLVSNFNNGNPLSLNQKNTVTNILKSEQIQKIKSLENWNKNDAQENRADILKGIINKDRQRFIDSLSPFLDK